MLNIICFSNTFSRYFSLTFILYSCLSLSAQTANIQVSSKNSQFWPETIPDTIILNKNISKLKIKIFEFNKIISKQALDGNFEDATEKQERMLAMLDSLEYLEKLVALTKLQLQLEAEKTKKEIALMNARNEWQMAYLKKQQLQRYVLLAGGALLILFIGGLFSRLRYLRKVKREMEMQNQNIASQKLRAEESGKIKEQFLANMSHEIRTPLNSIMGMSYILKKNEHYPEQKQYFDAICQSSENLLIILNDILDLSRLESGKIEIEKVPFRPVDELMKLRELLKYKAEEKGIDLNCELHPGIPEILVGDPVKLNQILLNLTGNAIKFTEKGKIKVSIFPKQIDEGMVNIEFSVKDTGIGIPEDRLDKIFESFTQAESNTSRKYGGTGLGLTISKQLIQLQNGDIQVESKPGEGSTFTFQIPFQIGKEKDIHVKQSALIDRKLKNLKILLVEDNEFNSIVEIEKLKNLIENVQIEIAITGKEAVNKVFSENYDLILMDIEMLEMNGYEAARHIRDMDSPKNEIPIIAMTAKAMKNDIQKCFDAGMNEFISKPFNPDELKSKILLLVEQDI